MIASFLFCTYLQGGDDACHCEDFTEPESREEHPGWLAVHEANKKRIGEKTYELVFLGDDLVENLNGLAYNEPIKQSKKIQTYFNETFVYEAGAAIDSIALGITGDSVRKCGRLGHLLSETSSQLTPFDYLVLLMVLCCDLGFQFIVAYGSR